MMTFLNTLKSRKDEHGFTMLEIVVAMVIIGILAATATPIVSKQIAEAKKTALRQELRGAVDEINGGWNEDEGFPTTTSQKFSEDTQVSIYGGNISTPGSGAGGNGSGTGGTPGSGSSSGNNAPGAGNGDGTFQPRETRQLTWEEFKAANLYDTGRPASAQAARHAVGKAGSAMVFNFNYTADRLSSLTELGQILRTDCNSVYYGYNRFLPPNTSADEQGRNLCNFIREEDSYMSPQEALSSLSIFKMTSSSYSDFGINKDSGAFGTSVTMPLTPVVDWNFPSTGTYTILITKSPTSLHQCDNFSRIDSDGDGQPDRFPRQGEGYTFNCSDFGAGYDFTAHNSRHVYDVIVLYTSTTNAAFGGRPSINAGFMTNKNVEAGDDVYITSQGGRYCSHVTVGSGKDCGRNNNGEQFNMTDQLPESWWSNYLNPPAAGGGTNTEPSTGGLNGVPRASAINSAYVGSYCIEAYQTKVDYWAHYSSETGRLEDGRCPTT